MNPFALFSHRPTHFEHVRDHAKLVAQTEREMRQALHHPANQGLASAEIVVTGINTYSMAAFRASRKPHPKMARESAAAGAHVAFEYLGVERG